MGDNLPVTDLGTSLTYEHLSCGGDHCCAISMFGAGKCWGRNHKGQLGVGDTDNRGDKVNTMGVDLPYLYFPPFTDIETISVFSNHTCSKTEGELRCWGENILGQLGYGDTSPRGGSFDALPGLLPPLF